MSDKEIEQVKEKEGQRLLAKIKPQATVITLEIQGKMLSSEGLAEEMQRRMTQGQSDFVFVIGGSNGLHEDVLQRSNYALSFSKMTFPHQMMRVVLIEQVYRAFKIMRAKHIINKFIFKYACLKIDIIILKIRVNMIPSFRQIRYQV